MSKAFSGGVNNSRYAPRADQPLERESAETIDRKFYAALALVKRTRPFQLDPYQRKGQGTNELPLSIHSHLDRSKAAPRAIR